MLSAHCTVTVLAILVVSLVVRSSDAFFAPLHPTVAALRQQAFAVKAEDRSENRGGHDVRGAGPPVELDPEEAKIQAAFAEHQQNAPKLGFPTDVRTLVAYNHGFAVMSTNSKA